MKRYTPSEGLAAITTVAEANRAVVAAFAALITILERDHNTVFPPGSLTIVFENVLTALFLASSDLQQLDITRQSSLGGGQTLLSNHFKRSTKEKNFSR